MECGTKMPPKSPEITFLRNPARRALERTHLDQSVYCRQFGIGGVDSPRTAPPGPPALACLLAQKVAFAVHSRCCWPVTRTACDNRRGAPGGGKTPSAKHHGHVVLSVPCTLHVAAAALAAKRAPKCSQLAMKNLPTRSNAEWPPVGAAGRDAARDLGLQPPVSLAACHGKHTHTHMCNPALQPKRLCALLCCGGTSECSISLCAIPCCGIESTGKTIIDAAAP